MVVDRGGRQGKVDRAIKSRLSKNVRYIPLLSRCLKCAAPFKTFSFHLPLPHTSFLILSFHSSTLFAFSFSTPLKIFSRFFFSSSSVFPHSLSSLLLPLSFSLSLSFFLVSRGWRERKLILEEYRPIKLPCDAVITYARLGERRRALQHYASRPPTIRYLIEEKKRRTTTKPPIA